MLTYDTLSFEKMHRMLQAFFCFVSLFLCLAAFLSKWGRAICSLSEVPLLTVFFHTVAVTSLTTIFWQLEGGDMRQATKINATFKQMSYFHPVQTL